MQRKSFPSLVIIHWFLKTAEQSGSNAFYPLYPNSEAESFRDTDHEHSYFRRCEGQIQFVLLYKWNRPASEKPNFKVCLSNLGQPKRWQDWEWIFPLLRCLLIHNIARLLLWTNGGKFSLLWHSWSPKSDFIGSRPWHFRITLIIKCMYTNITATIFWPILYYYIKKPGWFVCSNHCILSK